MIYLDHHATTPVDPRVLERMLPYFSEKFGNASSRNHSLGWQGEEAVDAARGQVARAIGATARELIFTSGATESNNLAILGLARRAGERNHVVTQATEHKAVLDPCEELGRHGFEVTVVGVDREGRVDPAEIAAACTDRTLLVSVMAANNEIGTYQPLGEIGALCKQRGIFFHTDATQGVGHIPLDVEAIGIDLLSLSGHKIYGPKGVGALFIRRRDPRVNLAPLVFGGGHERGSRSGTLNVPGIVGLGAAATIAVESMAEEAPRISRLRDLLEELVFAGIDGVHRNGPTTDRHPGNSNLSFEGVDAEALIMGLRDIAVSSGAACASATLEPSHVLEAIGVPRKLAHGSVRFGLGRGTTEAQIRTVAARVQEKVSHLRAL